MPNTQPQNKPSMKMAVTLMVIGTVLFLGLIGSVFFSAGQNKSPATAQPQTVTTNNSAENPPTFDKNEFNDVILVQPTAATSPKITTPTPTQKATTVAASNTTSTGAVLVAPAASDILASEELFALLNQETIVQSTFTIDPVPKQRKIWIWVKEPMETNKLQAKAWLQNNGYGHIQEKNIIYIQQ